MRNNPSVVILPAETVKFSVVRHEAVPVIVSASMW